MTFCDVMSGAIFVVADLNNLALFGVAVALPFLPCCWLTALLLVEGVEVLCLTRGGVFFFGIGFRAFKLLVGGGSFFEDDPCLSLLFNDSLGLFFAFFLLHF